MPFWQANCSFRDENMQLETEVIRRKRILLVEDERAVRETLRLLLPKDTYTVVEANNGAEAFMLFLKTQFDLVVTDLEMPFVKGNELAAKIKRVAPRQPILMITAYEKEAGLDNPVDAVVSKPFDLVRLRETIWKLLSPAAESAPDFKSRTALGADSEFVCA